MSFSSIVFIWIFLPIIFCVTLLLQKNSLKNLENPVMLVASLVFYAWGDLKSLVYLLVVITVIWIGGKYASKRPVLVICVTGLLASLVYYKYWSFGIGQINLLFSMSIGIEKIIAPLGISFVTFQAIAYLVDIYRNDIEAEQSWTKVALYIAFFPQIISGPIVRYMNVKNQIESRTITLVNVKAGLERFIIGLGKKVIIADCMGYMVDTILAFDSSMWGSVFAWLVLVGYSLQIYYDFSGYTDMALGLGKIFGFNLPENFQYPYTSTSIKEFWRKWHITLSSWFRDYLYIPLGGNKNGRWSTYKNLLIVFFVTGLWHGANWNFIIWGLWHGLFSLLERGRWGDLLRNNPRKIWNRLYTISVVSVGWMFFRIPSINKVIDLLKCLIIPTKMSSSLSTYYFINSYTIIIIIVGILCCGPIQCLLKKLQNCTCNKLEGVKWLGFIIILIYSLTQVVSSTYSGFIYQQF